MQRHHSQSVPGTSQDQRPAGSDEWRTPRGRARKCRPIINRPWPPLNNATPAHRRRPQSVRGFTLIEMLVAVTVAGVLTSVALPSFEGVLHRARRSDVLVSMMQIQSAQERFRSYGSSYGSLAAIGVAARSTSGHYSLQVASFDPQGYEVLATAIGPQARDTACSTMKVTVAGANVDYASGADASVSNATAANRSCWSL